MAQPLHLFSPQEQSSEASSLCSFHLKGCCFDPRKTIAGYLAAPCFGCRDIKDE